MTLSATDATDDQVVEVDEQDLEQQAAAADNGDQGEAGDKPEATTEEPDEVLVSIGEPKAEVDDSQQQDTEAIRNLRNAHRDQTRRIRELERENQQLKSGGEKAKAVEVGEKPKMSDPDIDFDEALYDKRLLDWQERKRQADEEKRKTQEKAQQAEEAWQAKQAAYGTAKAALKVPDFDDAEGNVLEALNAAQQAVIKWGADNSALVFYALGKNQARLKELAAITEPVKFAFAVSKLEAQLKVTPKKVAPAPERVVRGSASVSGGAAEKKLEQLRAEAAKTGDLSKVIAFKKSMRAN